MRGKLCPERSSLLVSLPVLIGAPLLGALAAFFGQRTLAAVLILLFLLAGFSRLWAYATARKLSVRLTSAVPGLFPGEETTVQLEIRNGKFLPVVWLDLFFPLSKRLCIVPQDRRESEQWELSELERIGACPNLVGEKRVSFLLWYETLRLSTRWTALRRGVYPLSGWCLRTGDGLGLTQTQRPVDGAEGRQFVVYPARVKVSPELFLRNLWNAETDSRGVMEDITVIRSTREYMPTDPVRSINWRLTARGLPLSVNVYEDILPQGAHFIFDGESFGGPGQHWEEMEDALSMIGSLVPLLAEKRVGCGLSLCQGAAGKAVDIFAPADPTQLLCALAAYEPMENKWDEEHRTILPQEPIFHAASILENARRAGRFYYVAYDADPLPSRKLLQQLDRADVTILTYRRTAPFGPFETLCLQQVKEGGHG